MDFRHLLGQSERDNNKVFLCPRTLECFHLVFILVFNGFKILTVQFEAFYGFSSLIFLYFIFEILLMFIF